MTQRDTRGFSGPVSMLKTCFSSRKGFHLKDESEEYEVAESETAVSTIGFEQLHWGNDFQYLMPSNADDEADDGDTPTEIGQRKRLKLSKAERKEARKLKREARKLPRALKMSLRSHSGDNGTAKLSEALKLIDSVPDSFQLHNTSLYRDDLLTLKPEEWLNDNVIMYVYNILETYQLKPFYNKYNLSADSILLIPPALCYLVLSSSDPQTLVSMFPEKFEKCKFLILPLNDGGSHWSLSVISVLDRVFYSYDSLTNLNAQESDQVCSNFSKIISLLLNAKNFRLTKQNLPTPQQLNDSDCGVFVICLTCFIVGELIGSHVTGKAWMINFNLNDRIQQVDCIAIRHFILRTILDRTIKSE